MWQQNQLKSGTLFVSKSKTSENIETSCSPAIQKDSSLTSVCMFPLEEEEDVRKQGEHVEEQAVSDSTQGRGQLMAQELITDAAQTIWLPNVQKGW